MAKVKKAFTDRLTGEVYLVGDDYDGAPDRIGELVEKGVLEAPKAPARRRAAKKGQ